MYYVRKQKVFNLRQFWSFIFYFYLNLEGNMKRRFISAIDNQSRFLYSVTGKKVKLQSTNEKKPRSMGQSTKKSSNALPKICLTLETVELNYQMQRTDQLYPPLHKKDPLKLIHYQLSFNSLFKFITVIWTISKFSLHLAVLEIYHMLLICESWYSEYYFECKHAPPPHLLKSYGLTKKGDWKVTGNI